MPGKKIAIGSDHAGTDLKSILIVRLEEQGHSVSDYGVPPGTLKSEYPQVARLLSEKIAQGTHECGILICGTGTGMAMAANKIKGVRAANCLNEVMARYAREHNDANVLTLGARIIGSELALSILESFLRWEFQGGRHLERIKMME
ncbi:MAG: ribose 5-phosphate isomerase B [Deltaproteobacteria bacterium]|jgi:ribose 5-phosphate isomerase B|nr:ribose 5-phosphate isomerase B [Deltaproteobacteria bacterium]